ncbi:uncharacterized protein LOC130674529 [Microplitis mediator]|uniref:uncharacterized protein LOC130674529 n=1 Tax=Microplitis mediator TaxID=375433 RepID=UPI0025554A96|nr:uncharacterized protein LOC130674529 [Microplitis mediator]
MDELNRKKFRLSIILNDAIIESLNFSKTEGFLANGETPVYLTNIHSLKKMLGSKIVDDYKFIKTTIEEYVPEIGGFRFYHNYQKSGSLIVFFNNYYISLEGNIGPYVLRRFPAEVFNDQNKYVYAKLIRPDQQTYYRKWDTPVDLSIMPYNLFSPKLQIVNSQLFLIVHPSSIDNKPRGELMRIILMFHNHLDMFFGNFTLPQIKLTIKGILLPDINKPILYQGDRELDLEFITHVTLKKSLTKFLIENKDYFHLELHDNIFFQFGSFIGGLIGFSYPTIPRACEVSPVCYKLFGTIHGDYQTYHILHLQYLAVLYGTNFNKKDEACPEISHSQARYVLSPPLLWTYCSVDQMSKYFIKHDCSYYNKHKPDLSLDITDPKDDRLRMSIGLKLYEQPEYSPNNKPMDISLNVSHGMQTKKVMCSCIP